MSDLAFTPVVAPRILAIVNQKGGVGKTTTAVNLATAMAACRKRVLAVDLDPQGNASTGFGVPRKARGADSYAVLIGEASIAEAALGPEVPGLGLVPAPPALSGAGPAMGIGSASCRESVWEEVKVMGGDG